MSKTAREDQKGAVKTPQQSGKVGVEFPVESEEISSPTYTFRFRALPDTIHVEISINGKAWEKCREALGIWWFDWRNYKPGNYELVARAINAHGDKTLSNRRKFSVQLIEQ